MPALDWNQLLRQPFLQEGVRSPAGADHAFLLRALREAREEPDVFLKRWARKALAFWHGREIPRNLDIYGWREQSLLLRATVWRAGICFPTGPLVPLAWLGAVVAARRREVRLVALSALAFGLLVALYFPCSRYRIPILPLTILLAGVGGQALVSVLRLRRWRMAGALAGLAVATGVAANAPLPWPTDRLRYDAHLWYAVGAGASADGDLTTAQACYEKALHCDPDFADVQCNLATLFARQQDATRAEASYEAAIAARPDHDLAHVGLARVLAERGQTERALQELALAETANPLNADAFFQHAVLLLRVGRRDDARTPLARAVAFNPDYLIQYRRIEAASPATP
jgi:tetratricopeptide (TPR) repeat protein